MYNKGSAWAVILVVILLIIIGAGGYYIWQNYFNKPQQPPPTTSKTEEKTELKLDTKKEATYLSKVADTKGVYWVRGLDLAWSQVEPEKGKLNWDMMDEKVAEFNEAEIYPLVIVKPYVNWDQDACHDASYEAEMALPEEKDKKVQTKIKVGKPCDMGAYKTFLEKAVERYDGDGKNDMPKLKIPIKYWEIINEPEMQGGSTGGMGEELKFFKGTGAEYLEILKASYETIKKADSGAKVAHAGMAGMQSNFQAFWTPIFQAGAGDYFDIANIHTINTGILREDLFVIKFKKYLEGFGIKDKPIWVTEVQYGDLTEKAKNLVDFDKLMAKSTVFSLAQGADKLFYIENWLFWDMPKEDFGKKPPKQVLESSTHKVYLNLVNKVNNFDKVEVIKEEFNENTRDDEGATSKVGQYKFISGSKEIFVLWGQAQIPAVLKGTVKITDIYGNSKELDAASIKLSDAPIFVEKVK